MSFFSWFRKRRPNPPSDHSRNVSLTVSPDNAICTLTPRGEPQIPVLFAGIKDLANPQHKTFVLGPEIPEWGADLDIKAEGYAPYHAWVVIPGSDTEWSAVQLKQALPSEPTREQILTAPHSFQGLIIPGTSYGNLPWFDGCIASFNDSDRKLIYQAKRACGDKVCALDLSWNYAEPGQPYGTGNLVPPCDLSNDLDRLVDLIKEILAAGFYVDLRLAGDGQSNPPYHDYNDPVGWTYGHQWLMNNLERIVTAVEKYIPYIIFCPGYDGVFYGWTPEQVRDYWHKLRYLIGDKGYSAIEYSIGVCHLGDGEATYDGGEPDLVYQEFNQNLHDESYWQLAARMLGPDYKRPDDDRNRDTPVWYLKKGTPRGKIYWNAYEWKTYCWTRNRCSISDIERDRDYLRNSGAILMG